jgi:signal transduction histidine kinase
LKFSEFLKDKIIAIVLTIFLVTTVIAFLSVTKIDLFIKIYIPTAIVVVFVIVLMLEYLHKKRFYNAVKESLQELDEKYLIAETMESPIFLDGKILKNILVETDKSMIEKVNKYKYAQEEYKEYIELWIHEIKTPISASKLIAQNNKNEVTKSIDEELDKIEYYVEQALYYARSNTVEKDYCITKCNLKDIVNTVIKKNKTTLINNKIKISIEDIDEIVYTDSKWIIFILNQIITNCIKYAKEENAEIKISAETKKARVILSIKDNGIGIRKGEITKVFEKGFTGSNGRKDGKKSTGIGLYLCRKLCGKLGIGIELNSEENIGTDIKLVFPKNNYHLAE